MSQNTKGDIYDRTVRSISWKVISNIVTVFANFVRTWLLARWLPVDIFGVYGMATAVVAISGVVANFGFGGAFLHHSKETEDEKSAAAVHFTLKFLFTLFWALILILLAVFLFEGQRRLALIVLTLIGTGVHLTQTPNLILVRRVVHRRLALISITDAMISALLAISLARAGANLWALIATNFVTLVVSVVMLYLWRPVWRPELKWDKDKVRYFLSFGWKNFIAVGLLKTLDNIDDLWTGTYLGDKALGFYSRAYNFATYPRKIVSTPVNTVATGTYAELKYDQKRLSQAFFRTNAYLIRIGFIFAGILALIAPEFIRIFLGRKWMPMLDTFRLMLVFTMLDPVKITVSNLFIAVGQPRRIVFARLIQLVVLIAGLYGLGFSMGITGVALAVDIMLVLGMGLLFWQARIFVKFSIRKLFLIPVLGLGVGMGLARASLLIPGISGNDWRTLVTKVLVFLPVYLAVLFMFERAESKSVFMGLYKQFAGFKRVQQIKQRLAKRIGK